MNAATSACSAEERSRVSGQELTDAVEKLHGNQASAAEERDIGA